MSGMYEGALQDLVDALGRLPGIGPKSAQRIAFHILQSESEIAASLVDAIRTVKERVKFCTECGNVSEELLCRICRDPRRETTSICVVEESKDVIAIERTREFRGKYHVLGGAISPIDGIGPDQLEIESLMKRIMEEKFHEMIFALSPNIQGDTTIYYIQKKMEHLTCRITTIARGIAFGGELEYADEMTLARSIANRLPIQQYVK